MAPPAQAAKAQPTGFGQQPIAVKIGILVFIVAGMSAIYYFALHTPLEEEISAAQARNRTLQEDMEEAEARQREYIRLREELAAREGLDRANLRVLPEAAEIPSFLQDLNRLAEMSGLAMRLVQPRPEEAAEHYVRLPVQLQVQGRFHQLARFMFNVSRLERAISMENIVLEEPTVQGEDVMLSVEVLATTYRRPRPDEAPPPQAGARPPTTPPARPRPAAGGSH